MICFLTTIKKLTMDYMRNKKTFLHFIKGILTTTKGYNVSLYNLRKTFVCGAGYCSFLLCLITMSKKVMCNR